MSAVKFMIGVLVFVQPALGQCPIPCPRQQYTYSCCHTNTATCCQGSGGTAECSIPKVPETTQEVYVEDCILKNFTRNVLANLRGLPVVKFHLEHVKIDSMSGDLFTDLPQLRDINLWNSYDVDIGNLSTALGSIQAKQNISVALIGLGIKTEDIEKIFSSINVSNIAYLSLERNGIEKPPFDILRTWSSLRFVSFAGNKISYIAPPQAPLVNIATLKLNQNRLSNTNNWQSLCEHLPALEELDLSTNEFTDEWQGFSCANWTSLKSLLLASNRIMFLNFSKLQNLPSLDSLDISRNWLSRMSNKTQMKSLRVLKLSKNEFSNFLPWFCSQKKRQSFALFPQLEHLDISFNLIRIPLNMNLHCLDKLRTLNMSGNPICVITNNTFASLTSLEDLFLSDNINGGLEHVDPTAFNNTNIKRLDLQSNGIVFDEMPGMLDIFQYLGRLTHLNLAHNKLDGLNETEMKQLLSPLVNVEFLNLTRTDIHQLPKGLLRNFKNLTTLILAKNRFEGDYLSDSFSSAINLQYLSLSQNFIHVVHNNSFVGRILKTLKEIDLTFNPFDCTCENRWFRNIIDTNLKSKNGIRLVDWPDKYCCKTAHSDCKTLLQDYHPSKRECETLDQMVIAYLTIASFVFVFTVTACFVYRFRWHIKYWMYKMNKEKRLSKDPEAQPLVTRSQQSDAFVIYSHKDRAVRAFIKDQFNPLMESFGYKLFLFDRDAGFGAKVSEIGDGIYGSKHVIALVTSSFLKDTWCKFQMEVAMDREINLQREYLMFVLLDDVDVKLLNKFWCVRFTKTPTARWCSDTNDIRRKALEAMIKKQLGDPRPNNLQIQQLYTRVGVPTQTT